MSDVMLFGVLRMPYEMAMADDLSRYQFWQRVQEAADRLESEARRLEVLRAERDHARACFDRSAKILAGIHAVIYPQLNTVDGVTYRFIAPDPHLYLQTLADRIRAIPDELGTLQSATPPSPSTASEIWEKDALSAYKDWAERRGALGTGAIPERIFFAGFAAGRRAALASTPVAREVEAIARNMMMLGFESGHIVSPEAAEDMLHQFDAAIRSSNPAPAGAAKGGNTSERTVVQNKAKTGAESPEPRTGSGFHGGAEVDAEAERKLFEKAVMDITCATPDSLKRDEDKPDDYDDYAVSIYWLIWKACAARRTQEGAKDAERFRQAIACEDSAEVLYGAVLSHAPNGKAIRNEFDAAIAATQTKESQE